MTYVRGSMHFSLHLVNFILDSIGQAFIKINQYLGSLSFVLMTVASLLSVLLQHFLWAATLFSWKITANVQRFAIYRFSLILLNNICLNPPTKIACSQSADIKRGVPILVCQSGAVPSQTNWFITDIYALYIRRKWTCLSAFFQYNTELPNGTIVLLAVSGAQREKFIFLRYFTTG